MIRIAAVYLALLALLALTVGSTFLPLGFGNTIANLTISGAKTALILIAFMGVGREGPLVRLAAALSGFWLLILFVLSWITLRGV